jgi:hypothetical protein
MGIEPTPLPKASVAPTPEATLPKPQVSPVAQPTPVATPEATKQPTPTATPEKSPSKAERKITPAEKTAPTPPKSQIKTREKPLVKSEPQPTPRAPRSRADMRAAAAKLKAMEKEWEASFNDPAVIEKSLADDFVGTSPAGKLMTKKDLLREAKEYSGPPPKTLARDLDVHFHGADIAVVTGAAKQIDRNRSGQIVERTFRFTDTWVERDGKWQCIASQSMLLPRE